MTGNATGLGRKPRVDVPPPSFLVLSGVNRTLRRKFFPNLPEDAD